MTYNGATYYYVYNMLGDIIGLSNAAGNLVVTYEYHPYGEIKEYTDTSGIDLANINPFRYKGYYFDTESGYYYLNSRYYDPELCRFLNADGYLSTGQGTIGFNMFAYCLNNPIKYVDYSGEIGIFGIGLCIGLFLGFALGAAVTSVDIDDKASEHYSRNELNHVDLTVDEIIDQYEKQPESADLYHENTSGKQGADAAYNDKYLSPDGGHIEVIICSPPDGSPYIVDELVDPINMGTYNYASNKSWAPFYVVEHFFRDMVPYYFFGNTKDDGDGLLKWAID